jgi:hypothetical protein
MGLTRLESIIYEIKFGRGVHVSLRLACFVVIESFVGRNGWTKDPVVICDKPDPRDARLLFRTRIKHTWWTQNPNWYPGGSVIFENGARLCIATMSIRGRRVHAFEDNAAIDFLWRRQELTDRVRAWMRHASMADLRAAAELLRGMALLKVMLPSYDYRPSLENGLLFTAEALGLRDLEEFVTLIDMGQPTAAVSTGA